MHKQLALHCLLPATHPLCCSFPLLQGIDDAESEWSQHHAKRMIDTRAKGLRGSIPPNFPYFHVEFGLSGRPRDL